MKYNLFKCTIQNINSSGFTVIFKSQPVLMRKLALGQKGVGQSLFPLGNTVQGSRTSSRNGTFSNPENKVIKGNCKRKRKKEKHKDSQK